VHDVFRKTVDGWQSPPRNTPPGCVGGGRDVYSTGLEGCEVHWVTFFRAILLPVCLWITLVEDAQGLADAGGAGRLGPVMDFAHICEGL